MKHVAKLVVVDDVQANLDLLRVLLVRDGYTVHCARDGVSALDLIGRESPDLVLTDVQMPKMNGFDLCQRIKEDRATRLTPVVLVTASGDRDHRLRGIEVGADDFLTKPIDTHELKARVRSLVKLKRFTDDLDSAESMILSLALTVEARDPCTGGHCERMAAYAAALGTHLGLSDEEVAALHRGGYLHDVGKVAIPDAILQKPGALTPDEFETMKRHTIVGAGLCGNLRLLRLVAPIVRHHHERLDGTGYPDGLAGDEIPFMAQIMSVVDIYDALTSDRPYRKAMPAEAACAELEREADAGWRNPEVVKALKELSQSGQLPTFPQSESRVS